MLGVENVHLIPGEGFLLVFSRPGLGRNTNMANQRPTNQQCRDTVYRNMCRSIYSEAHKMMAKWNAAGRLLHTAAAATENAMSPLTADTDCPLPAAVTDSK